MDLNLDEGSCRPQDVKYDLGPHIKRLPEELIPAIQKFLIIAKTSIVGKVNDSLQIIISPLLSSSTNPLCPSVYNPGRI